MTFSPYKLQKHLSRGYVRQVERPLPEGDIEAPQPFRHWVVIPVCDEPELPEALRQWGRILPSEAAVLLVVNHPETAEPGRKQRNRLLLAQLRAGEGFGVASRQLCWVDAASEGRELHRGVGEARRIGYDSALSLLEPEKLEQSLLVACDGDTRIHPDYWTVLMNTVSAHEDCGAFCLGVRHQQGSTAAEETAIRKYERYLQDYVDGLREAGSPYAYHSIGSAIAVRASAYLQAGGMRVYEAGEDFYFLQALRKVTRIHQMTEALVYPSARPSDRVPFGTGRAMISLLEGQSLPVYPAEAFRQLKMMLDGADEDSLESAEKFLSRQTVQARTFLERNRFAEAWSRITGNLPKRAGARTDAFHEWFDALRTYRFIHSFMTEFMSLNS